MEVLLCPGNVSCCPSVFCKCVVLFPRVLEVTCHVRPQCALVCVLWPLVVPRGLLEGSSPHYTPGGTITKAESYTLVNPAPPLTLFLFLSLTLFLYVFLFIFFYLYMYRSGGKKVQCFLCIKKKRRMLKERRQTSFCTLIFPEYDTQFWLPTTVSIHQTPTQNIYLRRLQALGFIS